MPIPVWLDIAQIAKLSHCSSYPTEITLWFCTKHPLAEEWADWAREQGFYFSSEADLAELFATLRAGLS